MRHGMYCESRGVIDGGEPKYSGIFLRPVENRPAFLLWREYCPYPQYRQSVKGIDGLQAGIYAYSPLFSSPGKLHDEPVNA